MYLVVLSTLVDGNGEFASEMSSHGKNRYADDPEPDRIGNHYYIGDAGQQKKTLARTNPIRVEERPAKNKKLKKGICTKHPQATRQKG